MEKSTKEKRLMTKACDSKEKELIAESSRMMIQTIREPINEEKGTAGIG
jgi:hypothetical protein